MQTLNVPILFRKLTFLSAFEEECLHQCETHTVAQSTGRAEPRWPQITAVGTQWQCSTVLEQVKTNTEVHIYAAVY